MLVNPASPPAPRVVALVLAAGRARRFGSDKRQACLPDGRSLLQAVLQTQLQACSDVRVLLREGDDWGQALCAQWGAAWQVVPDADQGMGHTLAAGLRALVTEEVVGTGGDHGDAQCAAHGARRFDAALVALADMPAVQPDTVRALIEAFHRDGRPGLALVRGPAGPPTPAAPLELARFARPAGRRGARQRLDWSLATRVDVPDAGILVDIDTPGDLGG